MPIPTPSPSGRDRAANRRTSRAAWARAAASALMAVALGAAAQAPVPDAPPTPRAPLPARAPANIATVEGIVGLYLVNEFGDVEGVVARDGTQVRFPAHMGPDLVRTLKPGDRFVASGDGTAGRGFRAYALGRPGATPLAEARPTTTVTPLPHDARVAALVEMRVDDTVASLLYAPRGEVDGVVLTNGTIVRLPPRSALLDAAKLKVGSRFAAIGYGTHNGYGRSLRAERVGIGGDPLTALQPHGPEASGSRYRPDPPIPPTPPTR